LEIFTIAPFLKHLYWGGHEIAALPNNRSFETVQSASFAFETYHFKGGASGIDYREKLTLDPSSERRLFGGELRTRSQAGACLFPMVTLSCGKKATVSSTGGEIIVFFL
jgi:hypothetical protein